VADGGTQADGGATSARRDRGSTQVALAAGVAAALVVALAAGLLAVRGGDEPTEVAAPLPTVSAEPTPTPEPEPECSTAERRFVPTSVSIPGVARRISVVAMARDAFDVPGVPALTSSGKSEMAFDLGSGIRPGDQRGNALLNAHTWPDGSALGNKLLDELHKGDPIIVQGPLGRLCYRVTDRVEVPWDDPGTRYYAKKGKPQIAIVVCSGERLGPGEWTKRTLWFAAPEA
jgi:hypothetical protein